MDPIKAEALRLATGFSSLVGADDPASVVSRAQAYEDYLRSVRRPASVDRSGEAGETRSDSTEGESAVPAQPGDAHPSPLHPQPQDTTNAS